MYKCADIQIYKYTHVRIYSKYTNLHLYKHENIQTYTKTQIYEYTFMLMLMLMFMFISIRPGTMHKWTNSQMHTCTNCIHRRGYGCTHHFDGTPCEEFDSRNVALLFCHGNPPRGDAHTSPSCVRLNCLGVPTPIPTSDARQVPNHPSPWSPWWPQPQNSYSRLTDERGVRRGMRGISVGG